MKLRAKHNVKINGVWHMGGEVFDADSAEGFEEHVENLDKISNVFPPNEEKKKPGRPRKTN